MFEKQHNNRIFEASLKSINLNPNNETMINAMLLLGHIYRKGYYTQDNDDLNINMLRSFSCYEKVFKAHDFEGLYYAVKVCTILDNYTLFSKIEQYLKQAQKKISTENEQYLFQKANELFLEKRPRRTSKRTTRSTASSSSSFSSPCTRRTRRG